MEKAGLSRANPIEMVGPGDSSRARDLYGPKTSLETHDLARKRSAPQRKIRLTSRLRLVPHCIAPDLLRIFTSFACCSGVSLFFIRTSSVTCARLISRSICQHLLQLSYPERIPAVRWQMAGGEDRLE